MGSILIKPVQRILKYPLMLNELIKCTEVEHSDRVDLMRARDIMTDVASFINESKRRKDIGKNSHQARYYYYYVVRTLQHSDYDLLECVHAL